MVDSKQIISYCKELGWRCGVSYGKTNNLRCIYPHIWKKDGDSVLSNWWTIVIYRDNCNYQEMCRIIDEAIYIIKGA